VGYGRTGEARRLQLGARLGVLGRFSGDLATPVEVELLGERYGRPDGGADHRVGRYGLPPPRGQAADEPVVGLHHRVGEEHLLHSTAQTARIARRRLSGSSRSPSAK